MISAPQPPQRAPHYFDNEQHGWPLEDCARNLIDKLAGWASEPVEFRGDARGRLWATPRADTERATLLFKSERYDGLIHLVRHESNWVCAEVFVAGAIKLRAWLEDPYEEKAFWPDGADGVGEGPGRISKRGSWLQVNMQRFDATLGAGYWSLSDTRW